VNSNSTDMILNVANDCFIYPYKIYKHSRFIFFAILAKFYPFRKDFKSCFVGLTDCADFYLSLYALNGMFYLAYDKVQLQRGFCFRCF
jgi:hypothetical protein